MTVRKAMKFKHIDVPEAHAYLSNPTWVMEQKHDGTFGMAILRGGQPPLMTLGNGTDAPLKHSAATQWLESHVWPALAAMQGVLGEGDEVVLTGEIMIHTGEYRIFDMPYAQVAGRVLSSPGNGFEGRRAALTGMLFSLGLAHMLTAQAVTTEEKVSMFTRARALGVEGVVLKHIRGHYDIDTRSAAMLKVKFVKTADVVVMGWSRSRNDAGREIGSITFGVLVDASRGFREVGRCSIIGKPEVAVGDVIEVAFLYWTGSTTYQPRMLRLREDKPAGECFMDQFLPYSREVV